VLVPSSQWTYATGIRYCEALLGVLELRERGSWPSDFQGNVKRDTPPPVPLLLIGKDEGDEYRYIDHDKCYPRSNAVLFWVRGHGENGSGGVATHRRRVESYIEELIGKQVEAATAARLAAIR